MPPRATKEASMLESFRDNYCLSNNDLVKSHGKEYRKVIQRLRKRGVGITNHRLSKEIGNKEGTIYVIDRDNPEVRIVWKKGFFSLDRSKPLEITELENGTVRTYEIRHKGRGWFQKLLDVFN